MFPSVDLNHLWNIERVDPRERICSNQDYTTVCIYLFLEITELYSLQDLNVVKACSDDFISRINIPAGSFKCDKFVRSSLASSIVGFMSGGSLELLSICSASCVVSIILDFQK
jgi:hypothetical protein